MGSAISLETSAFAETEQPPTTRAGARERVELQRRQWAEHREREAAARARAFPPPLPLQIGRWGAVQPGVPTEVAANISRWVDYLRGVHPQNLGIPERIVVCRLFATVAALRPARDWEAMRLHFAEALRTLDPVVFGLERPLAERVDPWKVPLDAEFVKRVFWALDEVYLGGVLAWYARMPLGTPPAPTFVAKLSLPEDDFWGLWHNSELVLEFRPPAGWSNFEFYMPASSEGWRYCEGELVSSPLAFMQSVVGHEMVHLIVGQFCGGRGDSHGQEFETLSLSLFGHFMPMVDKLEDVTEEVHKQIAAKLASGKKFSVATKDTAGAPGRPFIPVGREYDDPDGPDYYRGYSIMRPGGVGEEVTYPASIHVSQIATPIQFQPLPEHLTIQRLAFKRYFGV